MKKGLMIVLSLGLIFGIVGLGHSADVKKGIHVGNAGAFTGDAAAPCMEIYNSSQIAVDEWQENLKQLEKLQSKIDQRESWQDLYHDFCPDIEKTDTFSLYRRETELLRRFLTVIFPVV